ncbi:molybdopterin-guanine dinucleotide biosynthesis protein B [Vogesella oryzae]|uniref:molybdopterin-guanine dinucleotide biosynthesis protein B n=1 Tax=Vogesella oryzae TaxID=1735285 RepID=UPI001FE5577E|nr:molybdopterin-guanine dinucleotide biosynthesis protein B [Vogesella oryzae]
MQKVLGIAGWSGSGKTTLIEALLPRLAAHGLRVSVIKHSHHDIEPDAAGKDSWRHRRAGAAEVMLLSPQRVAVFAELAQELSLAEQLARLQPVDLVLLEGQKWQPVPKLEVHRPALGKPLLCRDDARVLAVASDAALDIAVPQLALNDYDAIAGFIVRWLKEST